MSIDTVLTVKRLDVLKKHLSTHPVPVAGCFKCRNLARWQSHKSRSFLADERTRKRTKRNYHAKKAEQS